MNTKRIFTQSEIATFKLCRFKHYLKYEKGLRRPGKSISALFGRAGHAGLESLYANGDRERAIEATEKHFDDFYFENLNHYIPNPSIYDKWRETYNAAVSVLSHYCDFYGFTQTAFPDRSFKVMPGMVEFPFRVPIVADSGRISRLFELAGKIDLVIDFDHRYWVVDHKFKLDVNDSLQDALRISFQMKCYVLALRMYTGLKVAGGCWNVLRRKMPGTPSINKNGTVSMSKVDTTVEIFQETLERQDQFLRNTTGKGLDFQRYEKELERLKNIKWFGRYFCEYPEEDLQEIQRELYVTVKTIQDCSQAGGQLSFKNDLACATFGSCEYRRFCQGISSGDEFVYDPNPHTELPLEIVCKKLKNGFKLDLNNHQLMGFENAFESVL
jgi:hypothetical protein